MKRPDIPIPDTPMENVDSDIERQVIVIDDDRDVREATEQTLVLQGFTVRTYGRAEHAVANIDIDFPGVVVCDIRMPGMDGLQLFAQLRQVDQDIPIILMTGHGDVDMAVQAMVTSTWQYRPCITAPTIS